MPTPSDLTARYPEFVQADTNAVGLLISEAALEVSQAAWGKFYAAGVLALAAHLLSIETRRGGHSAGPLPGPLTAKSVEAISLSYAASPIDSMDEAMLASTAYGQRYLYLRKLIAVPIGVVP